MEDDIGKRLRETADRSIKAYEGWAKGKKEAGAREELMEAVHELRKVASRVEIEVAVSERDEMASRPLAIPPHRAQRPRTGEMTDFMPNDNNDDAQPSSNASSGGGDRGGGGPRRRPMRSNNPRPQQDDNQGNS